MENRRPLYCLLLLFLLGLMLSCVQLPEHARPRLIPPNVDDLVGREGFSYGQLGIKDFQAKSLLPDRRQYQHNIGAQSCISIRPSKDSKFTIVQSHYQDVVFYAGSISHLSFEAIFVPSCSWWNPNIAQSREEYILQHEQIHFALAELAARKLTLEAGQKAKNFLAIGNTYSEIKKDMTEKLKSMEREAMEVSLEEHADFDKDTSLSYNPRVQRRWLADVNARLAK